MQRWAWQDMAKALQTDYECSKEILTPAAAPPRKHVPPGGGWLELSADALTPSTCDFDVRQGLSVADFLIE